MNPFIQKYKFHFLIVFIGLIWLFALQFILQIGSQNILYPDSYSYFVAAKNLFVFHRGHPYRPILLAFINGFPYLFGFGDGTIFKWSLVVNTFCFLFSNFILFELLKQFLKAKKAFWFTLLFLFSVGCSSIVFHLLAENVFIFFLLLSFYFLKKYYDANNFLYLSIALSILILSILIKPASKFIAIILVLCFAKILISNYRNKAIFFIYISIFAVFVQIVGVKHQFGNYTISYIDVVTFHNYVGSKAKCIESKTAYVEKNNPRADYLFSYKVKEQNEIAKKDFIDQIQNNKINLLKAYFKNIFENISTGNLIILDGKNIKKTTYFEIAKSFFYKASVFQNLFLTISGFLLAIFFLVKNKKTNVFYAFVGFMVFYIVLISGISSDQGDRFSLVVFPFCILLIAKFSEETKLFSAPLQK